MFRKKKKNQKEFEEILFPSKKQEKNKPDLPVRIKSEDNYAVIEPFDVWNQKTTIKQKPIISKEVIEIRKKKPKEEVKKEETKPEEKTKEEPKKEEKKKEEIKPKLIIQKKEIKSETPVQGNLPKPPEKPPKTEEPISKIPLDHIETDIDKLMEIIDEKKIVGIEYLSKSLKISVERLETWAKILEDRGLIDIEYPLIGLPKLRKKEWKKKS